MKQFLIVSLMITFATVGYAKDRHERRENRQQVRIEKGVENGSLTKREEKRLKKQQQHIDRMQEKAAADGTITDQEKLRLEKAQDRANRRIMKQKHDGQGRPEDVTSPTEPTEPAAAE